MRVLMVGAEVAPVAKVGGLGDVLGALPRALADLGIEVAVAMPCYRGTRERVEAHERAVRVYRGDHTRWNEIVQRGMRGDYSWQRSAQEYLKLYRRLAGGS
ncbi:MAG: glycogen/starch synthase [Candidatus Bipolaricaulota bacterium]